jgi:hypothetical protein
MKTATQMVAGGYEYALVPLGVNPSKRAMCPPEWRYGYNHKRLQ